MTSPLMRGMRNQAYTQNLAVSHASTLSPVLDFFSKVGALRGQYSEALNYFIEAYDHDPLLALKALFWARDIRGGAGERDVPRYILEWLAQNDPKVATHILPLVPYYGRWDDLWILFETRVESAVINLLEEQMYTDLRAINSEGEGASITLLGKWLPSENASSKQTKRDAWRIINALGIRPREYRQARVALRRHLDIVEARMSAKDWRGIDYEGVPSRAMKIYRNAFKKHDPEGFQAYLGSVQRGEKTIKAATLYPYDLVRTYIRIAEMGASLSRRRPSNDVDPVIEAQWAALPNYLEGGSVLSIVDVSGSMFSGAPGIKTADPIDISVSLGIYTAERARGPFQNYWMTFSGNPTLQKLEGDTLYDKISSIDWRNWMMNTNLQASFGLILNTARRYRIAEEDMPKMLLVISDMQFDPTKSGSTNLREIDRQYAESGYQRPVLVWWNVNAFSDTPATFTDEGNVLVSGASPSIFKALMAADIEKLRRATPEEHMLDVLGSDRYALVTLPE